MWVFRAWGRLGTTVGGNKLEQFDSIHDAVRDFKRLYEEKTGNRWENRKHFQKVAGRFYPMDLDYGEVGASRPTRGGCQSADILLLAVCLCVCVVSADLPCRSAVCLCLCCISGFTMSIAAALRFGDGHLVVVGNWR